MSAVDDRTIRASSRRIGLLVGVSSALIIAAGVAALVWLIRTRARPEHQGGRPHGMGDHIVIDVDDVVPWLVAFAVTTVALLGFIAWAAARRAVRPLVEALRLQRNFVADASHELRTPLAALVGRTQILERRRGRGQPIDDVVVKLRRDAESMGDVLTDLLTAAAVDAGSVQEESGETSSDPRAAIDRAVERIEPLAAPRNVKIVRTGEDMPTGEGGARVGLPEATLTRACVALIDNAVDHSPQAGAVTVDCRLRGRSVEIRVADEGPGIPAAERERVFQRFARGPETGRHRGFGLGLALVREVAVRAGGRVEIERSSAEGTVFLLSLPALG